MVRRLVCLVLAALLVVMAPAQAKAGALDVARVRTLDYLEPHTGTAGVLVANMVEALYANGVDANSWPTPEDPVAWRIIAPPSGSNISILRPLRALAFVGDPSAGQQGSFTANVLGRFTSEGYGDPRQANDDAYAILAVRAAGIPADDSRVQAARGHLLAGANADGGWGWGTSAPSGTDMTGMVLEALSASGGIPPGTAVNASAFLQGTRMEPGFAEAPGGAANCESTVWGLRASARLGLEVRQDDWTFLLGLQQPDGGFAHLPGSGSDLLCTTEAFSVLGDAAQGRVPGPTPDGPQGRAGLGALGLPATVLLVSAIALGLRPRRH